MKYQHPSISLEDCQDFVSLTLVIRSRHLRPLQNFLKSYLKRTVKFERNEDGLFQTKIESSQFPASVVRALYQDELAELRRRFTAHISYDNPRKTSAELQSHLMDSRQKREHYEERAKMIISDWNGNEKVKAERLLPMLEAEIANCWKFIDDVYAPVSEKDWTGSQPF
jgi:hypothetical protein